VPTERIAFAACSKFNHDARQDVWNQILAQQPQHLLLLGDQIYMDWKGEAGDQYTPVPGFKGYSLGGPAKAGDAEFEAQMRLRYAAQFEVASFRTLIHAVLSGGGQLGMIWDDHDFGFNNALGLAGGPTDHDYADKIISGTKKLISRRLFEEFRWNLLRLKDDAAAAYATQPPSASPGQPGGVQQVLHLQHIDVLMLDIRWSRQSPTPDTYPAPQSEILGRDQFDWLGDEARASRKNVILIASGSPLTQSGLFSDQSWKNARADGGRYFHPYVEYDGLLRLASELRQSGKRLLFVGGDRHDVDFIDDLDDLPEIVCGGAAAPKGEQGFGILDLDGSGQALMTLFENGRPAKGKWTKKPVFEGIAAGTAGIASFLAAATDSPPMTTGAASRDTGDANAAVSAGGFSTRFLVTNRRLDDGKPTDIATDSLHYFFFPGTAYQGNKHDLRKWNSVSAEAFHSQVAAALATLRARPNLRAQQACIFVPGNRKTNAEVIEQCAELDELCFNAAGGAPLGVCIAFDWATNASNSPDFSGTYQDNIHRAPGAARLLSSLLLDLRTSLDGAQLQDVGLSVMAQSLGNRVAAGAIRAMPLAGGRPAVALYMAHAADLPYDLFSLPEGAEVAARCASVVVPHTVSDNVLGFAYRAVPDGGPRVGQLGPAPRAADNPPANVCFYDVLDICHLQYPHDGLFLSNNNWAQARREKGPFASQFYAAMRDGWWPA
jgi:alkaline phosphatase D